jgi:Domain of unknown function (DUF4416)
MAEPRTVAPLLLVVAAFSASPDVLAWAARRLESRFGPIGLASFCYDFLQTRYYEKTMGPGLRKCFYVCQDLVSPDQLASIKLATNSMEEEAIGLGLIEATRPLNLDPGLLSLGKFMLATTKDQAHRIYLREGIYAEVTLRFQAGEFQAWPWTYADYQLPVVREFLGCARDYYRSLLNHFKQVESDEPA